MSLIDAKTIISKFGLERHPEGGWYKRTYTSKVMREGFANQGLRPVCTAIYYLLYAKDFSAFHRLQADEMWHFYYGNSLTLYHFDPVGNLHSQVLGNAIIDPHACYQFNIPANEWFAAETNGTEGFSLVGCTVAPGFTFEDFELADRQALIDQYPEHSAIITRLTQTTGFARKPM